jgi:hypothetical protein
MALETKIPNLLAYAVRRIAALEGDAPLAAMSTTLGAVKDEPKQIEILRGMNDALRGRRSVPMPGRLGADRRRR